MSRLKIYRGGEHEHAAQKPELWAAVSKEVDEHV